MSLITEILAINVKLSQNESKTPTVSYANAVQHPTKEQAIIIQSKQGLTIEDYCVAVGNIVQPINVRYISRISQERVCIYLSSKDLANKLIENHPTVKIKEHELEIKPLISKTKRILISNVQPIIPSAVIEEELKKHDIIPVSKINNIRASTLHQTKHQATRMCLVSEDKCLLNLKMKLKFRKCSKLNTMIQHIGFTS